MLRIRQTWFYHIGVIMQGFRKFIIALTALLMIISVPLAAAQMTVRWEWLLDDPDVTAYRYQLDGEEPDGWTVVSGDTDSVEFTGLDADKAYTLYVQRSYDGEHWSASAASTAEMEEPAPAVEEPVAEEPIVRTYEYAGYTLTATISTGSTVLGYPSFVSDSDATAFIALENGRYGYGDMGVVYSLEGDGTALFTYPETFAKETVAAEIDRLVEDLIAYITPAPAPEPVPEPAPAVEEPVAEEPIVRTYEYGGYSLVATIDTGATLLEYPSFVTDDEENGFFAVENSKYGLADLGVVYSFGEPGNVTLTYPEEYSKETVAAELDILVEDLIAYITAPVEVAEPQPAEEPAAAEEPVAEEPVAETEAPAEEEAPAPAEESGSGFAFSLLFRGGVMSAFDESFRFNGDIFAEAGIGLGFDNIITMGEHFGLGLRSDIVVDFLPKYGWDCYSNDVLEYFNVMNYAEIVSADLKLMMDVASGPVDLYLGGGAGFAIGNPHTLFTDYLGMGTIGKGAMEFSMDWFASGTAGVRFYLGNVFSFGVEANYRYMVNAQRHLGSADVVLGFTF